MKIMEKFIVSLFSAGEGAMCTYFTLAEDKRQALIVALVEFLIKENYNLTETISRDGLVDDDMNDLQRDTFNELLDLFNDEHYVYTLNEDWEIYFDVVQKPNDY